MATKGKDKETEPKGAKPSEFENGVVSVLKDLSATISELSKDVKGVVSRVDSLELNTGNAPATAQIKEAIAKKKGEAPKVKVVERDETLQEKRIDPRYREVVDRILGEQFVAWEDYEGVLPGHFKFNVLIPAELSSVPADTHARAGCDHDKDVCKVAPDVRSKVISFAEHVNGVEEWCKLVRQNLNKYYSQNAIRSPFGQ